jgi:hypothetical protein
MSRLPYICNFRAIVHVWQEDPDGDGRTMWHPFAHEVFDLATWTDGFEFRSLKQYEKDKFDLSKYLNSEIQMVEGEDSFRNDGMMSAVDYGKEIIENGDIIHSIIEGDIKPDGERYYEIIGKLHFHSYRGYDGEWDSEEDLSEIKFQELAQNDVYKWARSQGIKLHP